MAWIVLLALIALPVLEITLFIATVQSIGFLATLFLVVAAGMLGVFLLRIQGISTAFRIRAQMERGEVPVAAAFDSLCLGLAGILFVIPGFCSDILAIALLLPPVRALLRRMVVSRMSRSGLDPRGPVVIDGDYTVVRSGDDPDPPSGGPTVVPGPKP